MYPQENIYSNISSLNQGTIHAQGHKVKNVKKIIIQIVISAAVS